MEKQKKKSLTDNYRILGSDEKEEETRQRLILVPCDSFQLSFHPLSEREYLSENIRQNEEKKEEK